MATTALFVVLATLTPTESFVAKPKATSAARLLKPGFQVMEQRLFDLTGDKRKERIVLVGRVDLSGLTRSYGILVCQNSKSRVSVLASSAFAQNSSYSRSLVSGTVDLDQDGHAEFAVDERAAGGGFSVHGRTYWKLEGHELVPIHYITLKMSFMKMVETRELKFVGQQKIAEKRVRKTTDETGKSDVKTTFIELVYDTWLRRFAPLWVRMLR